MNYPFYWLITSNFSEEWEQFAFVWKLTGKPSAHDWLETYNMIRRWCKIEPIEEAWAETIAIKMKSVEMMEDLEEINKFLKMKGCHL